MPAAEHSAQHDSPPHDQLIGEQFSWFSNPLDWRPIDRFILLAGLTLLAPLLFGGALLFAMRWYPHHLQADAANLLLLIYIAQSVVIGALLLHALARRKWQADHPTLENMLIVFFLLNTLSSGYATGTHLSNGLLLLFLGINISSALANIDKIRLGYYAACVVTLLVVMLGDVLQMLPYAPLFAVPPYDVRHAPLGGWLFIQAMLAIILLALLAICIAAIRRWVERESTYREMSMIDGLTRLTNRRCLIERGEKELARARRLPAGGTSSFGCIMLDLDHFKHINDTYGHQAGDQVLVIASQILQDSARRYDEVGRYGGEEFVLLLPSISAEDAANVAERIRDKIASTQITLDDGTCISITASLGVACYPTLGVDHLNDLLKAADDALYRAKDSGRNQVVIAREEDAPPQGTTTP